MSNLADKRNRFELLMQQAEIPADIVRSFFAEGYIDQVEISRKNRDWTFYLVKNELVPQNIYRSFCKMIQEKFAQIAKIRFIWKYEEVEPAALVEEYWSLFMEWLQREVPSINGWMSKARFEVQGHTLLRSLCWMQIGLELAKKKNIDIFIRNFFHNFFQTN